MHFSARILKIDGRFRDKIFAPASKCWSVQTAIRINNVNAILPLYDIVIIQITNVQRFRLIVKMHPVILTSVIKAQIAHKTPPLIH